MAEDEKLVSSKYIIEKSGISRATLNNYIKGGLIPKPFVRRPFDCDKGPKAIGYFPSQVLGLLNRIQLLKADGYSMAMIGDALKKGTENSLSYPPHAEIGFKERPSETLPLFAGDLSSADRHKEVSLPKTAYPSPMTILPPLLRFCVMTVSLQDAERIALEHTPEVFFALLDSIWGAVDDIVITNGGLVSHPERDRMIVYFINREDRAYMENALRTALSIRRTMGSMIEEKHTGPLFRLGGHYLNIGLSYGEEYLMLIEHRAKRIATSPGLAAAESMALSQYADRGAVWATKNLLCRLPPEKRSSVHFGVTRGGKFEDSVFSLLSDMISEGRPRTAVLPETAAGIVAAEIIDGTL